MWAIIVREYFSPQEAGMRVGVVVGATLLGMALGGWMSGTIFDLTGPPAASAKNEARKTAPGDRVAGTMFR